MFDWHRARYARRSRSVGEGGLARSIGRTLVTIAVTLIAAAAPAVASRAVAATRRAQEATSEARPAAERATPREAMTGYLTACRAGDYSRAATFLDLPGERGSPGATPAAELARRLKIVLDQKLRIDLDGLSDAPEGDPDDGLAPGRDRAGIIPTPTVGVDVILERMQNGGGVFAWSIAASTVARIDEIYEQSGYSSLPEWLPRPLVEIHFLEVALWQWIGLMLLLVLSFLAAWIAARIAVRLLRPLAARTRTDIDDRLIELTTGPLRLLATIAFLAVSAKVLRLALPAQQFVDGAAKVLIIVGVAWLLMRIVDLLAAAARDRLLQHGRTGATHLVPLGARALERSVGGITFLAALDNLGFDVTTVIAGLGVGGLAVALAAQKTVENVFGGISVLVDQPVLPGDFCRFGDQVGTVEDIGIRSTRIRTLDRTVISIPNAEFSTLRLENFAKRDRVWLKFTLGLRYETSADQLRYVLAELRRMLIAHPRLLPDPLRARFVGFGASSLDVEVFGYVDTADYNEFLAVREDVYLRTIDIVQAAGTGFAFPSSTTYLARDSGLDPDKSRAAEGAIAKWREEGTLMFPEFAHDEIERLHGTLDYPPKGSAIGVST